MYKFSILILVFSLSLFSCKKIEGKGGRSSITGKVFMKDKSGNNQGEYFMPNYRVFIIYGEDDDIYNDDMRTNYDGSFKFENLREGTYKVFTYTTDYTNPSGLKAVFKSAEVGKKEDVDVGIIEIEK